MKTKFTKKGRRILSAALCLLMMITALPMSAFAWTSEEGKSCTSSFGDYYVGSDGEYYRSKATYSFIVYDSKGNITVQSINAGNAKRKYLMTDNSGTHQVYCVESGVDFNTGNSYVSESGKNSSYFQNLPTDAQFGIMMGCTAGTRVNPLPLQAQMQMIMLLRPRQLSGNISSSSAQAPQTARVQTGLTGTLTTIP